MKKLMIVLLLLAAACGLESSPLRHREDPHVGETCQCDVAEGMVVVEVLHGDDGSVGVYCAHEVGNPPLALCNVRR